MGEGQAAESEGGGISCTSRTVMEDPDGGAAQHGCLAVCSASGIAVALLLGALCVVHEASNSSSRLELGFTKVHVRTCSRNFYFQSSGIEDVLE